MPFFIEISQSQDAWCVRPVRRAYSNLIGPSCGASYKMDAAEVGRRSERERESVCFSKRISLNVARKRGGCRCLFKWNSRMIFLEKLESTFAQYLGHPGRVKRQTTNAGKEMDEKIFGTTMGWPSVTAAGALLLSASRSFLLFHSVFTYFQGELAPRETCHLRDGWPLHDASFSSIALISSSQITIALKKKKEKQEWPFRSRNSPSATYVFDFSSNSAHSLMRFSSIVLFLLFVTKWNTSLCEYCEHFFQVPSEANELKSQEMDPVSIVIDGNFSARADGNQKFSGKKRLRLPCKTRCVQPIRFHLARLPRRTHSTDPPDDPDGIARLIKEPTNHRTRISSQAMCVKENVF